MHERYCMTVINNGGVAEYEATTYCIQSNSILNKSKLFNIVDDDTLEGVFPLTIMILLKIYIIFYVERASSKQTHLITEVATKPTPFKTNWFFY